MHDSNSRTRRASWTGMDISDASLLPGSDDVISRIKLKGITSKLVIPNKPLQ